MSAGDKREATRRLLDAAIRQHRSGNLLEAVPLYRQVLESEPLHAETLQLLGVLAHQAGQIRQVFPFMRQAQAVDPAVSWFHGNLAEIYRARGIGTAALASARRALALDPTAHEAQLVLGNLLGDEERLAPAAAAFQRALALAPAYADALNNLGDIWSRLDEPASAARYFRRVLILDPDHAAAENNLANALYAEGEAGAALRHFRCASALKPDSAETHVGRGVALRALAAFAAAEGSYGRALALNADSVEARYNLSLIQLMEGDFARGWAGFQLRRRVRAFRPIRPEPSEPLWSGERLQGRAILLHAEQGHGDAIQFARYAPMVAALGGSVILECHPALYRLFASLAGVARLIRRGEETPGYPVHCPLMSLGQVLGTTADSIPAKVPYLAPPAASLQSWRERLDRLARPRIGLCWRGSRSFREDRTRSPGLAALAPILAVGKASFVALMPDPEPHPRILDVSEAFVDFAETAAAIEALDLVITSDTAVAHLAGALGRPAWVMLQHVADWRWLRNRADAPWYPTLILYRQRRPGDWNEVAERIAADLAASF